MHPGSAFVANKKRFRWAVLLDKRFEGAKICIIDPAHPFHLDTHFSLT